MPYIKIIIHCVWSTKNRIATLHNTSHRHSLWEHICHNAKEKGIFIESIGGEKEHIHCLISLGSGQNISQQLQLMKGEAAHWFNLQGWGKLEWQTEYFAVSVGESQLAAVKAYIANQEEHHRRKTFNEEYEEFINAYGFKREDWAKAQ